MFRSNGYSKKLVKGDGPVPCDVMIIGEAPGAEEDTQGKPFVGRAGRVLNEALTAAGIDRSQVYITNVVKRRPPDNRTPTLDEIDEYWPLLMKEIIAVQPTYILTLGNTALHTMTKYEGGIMKHRGRVAQYHSIFLCNVGPVKEMYATIHPSAVRSRETREIFFKDIAVFAKLIGGAYTTP